MVVTCERRCWVRAAVLAALLLWAPQRALCQAEGSHATSSAQAKAHFARGREHFRAGRYREAIVELKAALELDPGSPNLMYNVAYTNELLGDLAEAIVYYRKYIELLPASAAEERKKIELTIRRLEGHKTQVRPLPAPVPAARPTPAPAPVPESRAPGRADTWFWLSLGSGVAVLGGAVAAGLLALDREDEVAAFVVGADGSSEKREDLVEEADRFALASDVLAASGGALLATAALLYFLRDPDAEPARKPPPARTALVPGQRGAMLVLHGHF